MCVTSAHNINLFWHQEEEEIDESEMPIVEMIETTEADGTQTTTKQIFKVL